MAAVRSTQAAVGGDWKVAAKNLAKPVVVNALLAGYHLKKFVISELGDKSASSGSTGTERSWWQHEIKKMNKCGIWACNAARQYKAVVAWKREIHTALRMQIARVGKDTPAGQHAQKILEAFAEWGAVLGGEVRRPLLLTSSAVDQPPDDLVNIGFDEFRKQLLGALDD